MNEVVESQPAEPSGGATVAPAMPAAPTPAEAVPAPASPTPPANGQVVEAINQVLRLMPGRCRLANLAEGGTGLFLALDPNTRQKLEGVSADKATPPPPDPGSLGPARTRVFVVEDDPVARQLLRLILAREPRYEMIQASDGLTAWEMLQQGLTPDICILDINLPRMDGLQLLERMRAHARFQQTPVLICTAVKNRETVIRAAPLRVSYYLLKPFSPQMVLAELAKVAGFQPRT